MTRSFDPKQKYKDVLQFPPDKAIIARGLVEHFSTGETKLKAVQMAAVDFADQYGLFLPRDKANMTSPVCKALRDADIFKQFEKKAGKAGYTLEASSRYEDFLDFLEENIDYGSRRDNGTFEEDLARHAVLSYYKKYGHIRANSVSNKIPPKIYKAIAELSIRGDADVIYVPKGSIVAVKHNGEKHMVEYYVD